jgi:hypothetical protein
MTAFVSKWELKLEMLWEAYECWERVSDLLQKMCRDLEDEIDDMHPPNLVGDKHLAVETAKNHLLKWKGAVTLEVQKMKSTIKDKTHVDIDFTHFFSENTENDDTTFEKQRTHTNKDDFYLLGKYCNNFICMLDSPFCVLDRPYKLPDQEGEFVDVSLLLEKCEETVNIADDLLEVSILAGDTALSPLPNGPKDIKQYFKNLEDYGFFTNGEEIANAKSQIRRNNPGIEL